MNSSLVQELNARIAALEADLDAVTTYAAVLEAERDNARNDLLSQSDFDARIRSAIERKAEPVGYCSEYGLSTLASKAHHYCLSVSKKAENEFQFPLYSTPPAAAVTEGWQLVPKEPTEEMLDAYWHQTGESKEMRSRTHAYMRRYYSAMLSASPSPVGEGRDGLIEALKAKAREVGPLFIEDIDEVVAALSLPENAEDRSNA